MEHSTIICRCEDVSLGEIEDAISLGAATFDDIKRLTRCGMGPCQAKMCLDAGNYYLSQNTSKEVSELPITNFRTPLRLVTMKALASKTSGNSFVKSVMDEGEVDGD